MSSIFILVCGDVCPTESNRNLFEKWKYQVTCERFDSSI